MTLDLVGAAVKLRQGVEHMHAVIAAQTDLFTHLYRTMTKENRIDPSIEDTRQMDPPEAPVRRQPTAEEVRNNYDAILRILLFPPEARPGHLKRVMCGWPYPDDRRRWSDLDHFAHDLAQEMYDTMMGVTELAIKASEIAGWQQDLADILAEMPVEDWPAQGREP